MKKIVESCKYVGLSGLALQNNKFNCSGNTAHTIGKCLHLAAISVFPYLMSITIIPFIPRCQWHYAINTYTS